MATSKRPNGKPPVPLNRRQLDDKRQEQLLETLVIRSEQLEKQFTQQSADLKLLLADMRGKNKRLTDLDTRVTCLENRKSA